jgi:DNA-binding response OmpR family regulator
VLIIEDETMVRPAMADQLHDAGWSVLEAGSGE